MSRTIRFVRGFLAALLLIALASGPAAQARGVDALFRPFAAFLLRETSEGAALARALIGRPVRTQSDFFEFVGRVEAGQNWRLRKELAFRLERIESEFITRARTNGRVAVATELRALAADRLASRLATADDRIYSAGEIIFAPMPASAYQRNVHRFLTAEGRAPVLGPEEALRIHLSGESLAGARLEWADFARLGTEGQNLSRMDLRFADATGLRAPGADLRGMRGTWADLSQSVLRDADLRSARLANADLRLADLRGADLSGANLSRARLTDAWIDDATQLPFSRAEAIRRGMVTRRPFSAPSAGNARATPPLQDVLDGMIATRRPVTGGPVIAFDREADMIGFFNRYGAELAGAGRWGSLTDRARSAFRVLMPSPQNLRNIRASDARFDRVARYLVDESEGLGYIPEDVLQAARYLIEHRANPQPSRIMEVLISTPDRDEAIALLREELERLLSVARSGGRIEPRFDASLARAGLSEPGSPVLRRPTQRMGFSTVRICPGSGVCQDWSDLAHIDFTAYGAAEAIPMRLSNWSRNFRHLPEHQEIVRVTTLPERLWPQIGELYSASRSGGSVQDAGLVMVEGRSGSVTYRNVTSGSATEIRTEDLAAALEAALAEAGPGVRRVRIFHTHPEQAGKISTSLSAQDTEVAEAVRTFLRHRAIDAPVEMYALPLSLERTGTAFRYTAQ